MVSDVEPDELERSYREGMGEDARTCYYASH
jgi:hypothetical protein